MEPDDRKNTPEDPENDDNNGSLLPKTSTKMFSWIALGFALIGLGITIHSTRRRKEA